VDRDAAFGFNGAPIGEQAMSDLDGLVAISFLTLAFALSGLWITRMAHDLALQVITGVAQGMPLSPRTREAIMLHMWLPTEVGAVGVLAFGAFGLLEMTNHVGSGGVSLLAQLSAFLLACASDFVFASVFFALFRYRAKLRREKLG
jgi:hypothetical protein